MQDSGIGLLGWGFFCFCFVLFFKCEERVLVSVVYYFRKYLGFLNDLSGFRHDFSAPELHRATLIKTKVFLCKLSTFKNNIVI